MLGSSASISEANTVLNTAVAEVLRQFADTLENAKDFNAALQNLIKEVIVKHKRIIFNGNGYDEKWLQEAEKRGLLNLKTTPDALARYLDEKNVELFTSHKVYTEKEMRSRHEIFLENYCKLIGIEANTMIDMVCKDVLPAVSEYALTLKNALVAEIAVRKLAPELQSKYELETLQKINALSTKAYDAVTKLQAVLDKTKHLSCAVECANAYKNEVLPTMETLRVAVDKLEGLVSSKYWPFPTYGDLLFSV
jgi:glutamine synthetase